MHHPQDIAHIMYLLLHIAKKKTKDRKVLGGTKLKGLKTLELSEVQGEDADRWRPRDGGANMRQ